jgi:hypothetical protein
MFGSISRRGFLGSFPTVPFLISGHPSLTPPATPWAGFPANEPDAVREIVGVSHGNLARVKDLVSARPALARASWDWGYGDWETPIDAASHVGNRPIAEFLIANGARPTIFTAAMMGQLPIVKEWVASIPDVQRTRGAHGLTMLAHARAGGPAAAEVLKYLESLGDADPRYTDLPLTAADHEAIAGEYVFGAAPTQRFKVAKNARGLGIQRPGYSDRNLFHQGELVFHPQGAEGVRIRFDVGAGRTASALVVEDGALITRAARA